MNIEQEQLDKAASSLRRALLAVTRLLATLDKAETQREELPRLLSVARNALGELEQL